MKQTCAVVYIRTADGGLQAGILPGAGGRLVFLGEPGGRNLLKSDPGNWDPAAFIEPSVDVDFKEFNGHISWLSPQVDWWNQQELAPHKRGDNWPPDPYMIYAGYSVKALTEERIELVGPASPVSGVQVTKGYAFTGPGRLECTTTLTNVRDEAVAWGLWSNTRLEPGVPFYVACEGVSADAVRYDDPDGFRGSFPDGRRWYTIAASGSAQEVANKAYLPTQKAWIGIFQENWLWVKEIAGIDWRGVHPDHTSVEIFMRVGGAPERQLLELEFHGPHTEIAPGASISQTEAWTFHRAVGVADERERLELLERIRGK